MMDRQAMQVCIVGGGPAGLVLAMQLGRLGCDVAVLEMSKAYERAFRGESMQPDTVGILHELGVANKLQASGWSETRALCVTERGRELLRIDLERKPYRHRFITEIPQSSLLDTLADELAALPNVQLLRGARVKSLLEDANGQVTGVVYLQDDASKQLHAQVVIGADGRYSKVRRLSGVPVKQVMLERDFLWCKLPVPQGWDERAIRILLHRARHLIVLPTYPGLLRTGINIQKGGFSEVRRRGIGEIHKVIDALDPQFGEHFREHIRDWSELNFLEIFTALAERWGKPGLLLIGDAAHTVTPLLGQGVNLAIEDAMVLAPLLHCQLSDNKAIDAAFIAAYQAVRQPHIDQVVKMQLFQERLLTLDSAAACMARRAYYMLLNRVGSVQSKLYDRLTYRRQRSLGHYA